MLLTGVGEGIKKQTLIKNFNIKEDKKDLFFCCVELDYSAQDTKGNKYSLEMVLTPSLQLDILLDDSSLGGVEDEYTTKLTFTHPPRNNKPSLSDGAIDEVAFVKQNMKDKLKEKVRRNNNLAVEIQGSVIITSK